MISLADYNAKGLNLLVQQFSQVSERSAAEYLAIPEALNTAVLLAADPGQARDDAALLLVRTPPMAAGAQVQGRTSWRKAGAMENHYLDLSVVAPAVGTAVVEQAYTDDLCLSSGLSGNVRLTIVVSNCPLVYSKASLAVTFGETSAKVLRLLQGDSSGARFTVLVPAGSPGVVDVAVAHTADVSKAARFEFTYIPNSQP